MSEYSLSGTSDAYVVDLSAGTAVRAAKIMAQGDSLTVGVVDNGDPVGDPPSERDGYRLDLFDLILAGGGWIDYVGGGQSGPADMLDPDHNALNGESLRNMVRNQDDSPVDLSVGLSTHTPDIVLMMAGTNDYGVSRDIFFSNRFPNLMLNYQRAIDQFYAYAGSDEKYLVLSTLTPKVSDGIPAEFADFINEGYSLVDGVEVPGDEGNGTYVPGLRALVAANQATHATLILFDNPVDVTGLSPDLVHFTNASYGLYAQEMYNTLLTEIGQAGGTFAAPSLAPPTLRTVSIDLFEGPVGHTLSLRCGGVAVSRRCGWGEREEKAAAGQGQQAGEG